MHSGSARLLLGSVVVITEVNIRILQFDDCVNGLTYNERQKC